MFNQKENLKYQSLFLICFFISTVLFLNSCGRFILKDEGVENKSIEESRCRLNELMIYDHLHNNPHYGDIEIWKKICFYENDRAELNIFGA